MGRKKSIQDNITAGENTNDPFEAMSNHINITHIEWENGLSWRPMKETVFKIENGWLYEKRKTIDGTTLKKYNLAYARVITYGNIEKTLN